MKMDNSPKGNSISRVDQGSKVRANISRRSGGGDHIVEKSVCSIRTAIEHNPERGGEVKHGECC